MIRILLVLVAIYLIVAAVSCSAMKVMRCTVFQPPAASASAVVGPATTCEMLP